jgi:uncharacterized protein with PIN domain
MRPVTLKVATDLRLFLAPKHRNVDIELVHDGTSSLGHVVESVGVPLPEVGSLQVNEREQLPRYRPQPGDVIAVGAVRRPQPLRGRGQFVLDVHLGALARRLRLLGVDTAYTVDADDDELVVIAETTNRILLTKDRGLLRRRAVARAAYVYGDNPDDQLRDICARFALVGAPWTRCMACNGLLQPARKVDVEHLLEAGTRRCFDDFARCPDCRRVYWHGAHAARLEAIVAGAMSS